MIKILILSAIVVLSATLGIFLSADKKKRMCVYAQFYEFNEQLILNMKYGKEKIKSVSDRFDFVKSAIAGNEVLEGEDGQFIKDYINSLGTTDARSQIDYLNERKEYLKKCKKDSEESYKKYSSLYFKVSLMLGILIAVLLA